LAVVDVAKHRNGPTNSDIRFNFIDKFTLFEERTDQYRPEPPLDAAAEGDPG
jgi:hypothetical protein